jgi:hypothetical protein
MQQAQPTELVEPPRSPSPRLPPAPPPSPVNPVREVDGDVSLDQASQTPYDPPEPNDLLEGIDWDKQLQALGIQHQSSEGRYVKCVRLVAKFRNKAIHRLSLACSRVSSAFDNRAACRRPIEIHVTSEVRYLF